MAWSVKGNAQAGPTYTFSATTDVLISSLTSTNAQAYGYFAISVSASGKIVVVGALGETANGYQGAGHAYVF